MAKNKVEILSKRQRQSKQIMRDKEIQLKRQYIIHRLRIVGIVSSIILIIALGIWSWKTSAISRMMQATSDKIYALTVQAGYLVENLNIDGNVRASKEEIEEVIGSDYPNGSIIDKPIFQLNLGEIRTRLEKIESVKSVSVERLLPNTISVRLLEREPVAVWQYMGKFSLVDDNGVVMGGLDVAPYKSKKLPQIVGEEAPKHVAGLLELLATKPELEKRFFAAIWVGDRRWNIRLHSSKANDSGEKYGGEYIEVMLPEKNPIAAWKKLAELQKKQQLLDRDIKVIDLRIDGRLSIKKPKSEVKSKRYNSKEI
jgi:cell division protein FtsQ